MRKFATKDADKTYGMFDKDGHFYIGDQQIGVIDNNLVVGDKEYQGTPGLWELIIMKKPDDSIYTQEDYEQYAEIMVKTNAMKKAGTNTPKSSKGWKWTNLLSNIWIMASKIAGNTGVRNEIVSICDELKRQKVLDVNAYKKIMSAL